ncbi:SLAC1 anion channel family protein [Aliiroseovarius crassostreae]|uniref:SLAC1 anion channel family protein n=1 Tax=Aliiroseovarius crassostreae TaxID=154981 RepID=A0A9Q9LUU9_9RHOB|nr:SLAC1 anion channel family protein [Aliiroseovarius crassostreae]UWP90402.1 SLAC1 anion channel family protein [Aliiroseovarius crassostreae]UWP93547.1 SLAC1 anion channel family protein [Aliiroseovarius crassostreae]UWP96735.1 SLAC1 anion channel family protein [Aliiroseovarius crassostreae]
MSDQTAPPEFSRLAHFPVTFFAIVMGLMGLTLALHAGAPVYPWMGAVSSLVWLISATVMGVVTVFYLAKALRYPGMVIEEWHHPVKLAFFPTITVSLLLLATATHAHAPELAEWIWLAGVVGQGALTIAVVSGWISHRSFEVGHLTPAWFIPAVGNVIVPVLGARIGYIETSWLFFSGGILFWIVLLTLVMNRLIFHDPIVARLFPTMVILIAPPAVAFIAYVGMVGEVDGFARMLMNAGYIFAALVLAQVPRLVKMPFALSWWALSFPLAALSIASFRFSQLDGARAHQTIAVLVLALLAVVIAGLVLRTIKALMKDEVFRPE